VLFNESTYFSCCLVTLRSFGDPIERCGDLHSVPWLLSTRTSLGLRKTDMHSFSHEALQHVDDLALRHCPPGLCLFGIEFKGSDGHPRGDRCCIGMSWEGSSIVDSINYIISNMEPPEPQEPQRSTSMPSHEINVYTASKRSGWISI
jgi:hypothetical protein